MKKIIIVLLTAVSSVSFAQVAIGKNNVSSPDSAIEFARGNKGIILPWVASADKVDAVATAVPGTLIFDSTDKRVKLKTNMGWTDLSQREGDVDLTLQNSLIENLNAKVIMGANKMDASPGILILSDNNKAMVLPKMDSPHLNIINPAAGMMAYDTLKHQLAIFNGSVWTFWKAQ